jgi:hypothetical protein
MPRKPLKIQMPAAETLGPRATEMLFGRKTPTLRQATEKVPQPGADLVNAYLRQALEADEADPAKAARYRRRATDVLSKELEARGYTLAGTREGVYTRWKRDDEPSVFVPTNMQASDFGDIVSETLTAIGLT